MISNNHTMTTLMYARLRAYIGTSGRKERSTRRVLQQSALSLERHPRHCVLLALPAQRSGGCDFVSYCDKKTTLSQLEAPVVATDLGVQRQSNRTQITTHYFVNNRAAAAAASRCWCVIVLSVFSIPANLHPLETPTIETDRSYYRSAGCHQLLRVLVFVLKAFCVAFCLCGGAVFNHSDRGLKR